MKNKNEIISFPNDAEFYDHINDCLDFSQALISCGAPGTGKTQKSKGCIAKRGADIYTRAAQGMTPSHIKGLLFVNRDDNTLEPFYHELSDIIFNAKKETVIYVEDMLLGEEAFTCCTHHRRHVPCRALFARSVLGG